MREGAGAMARTTGTESKRPPGRPVEFDRDVALRAAMNEFWKHGFEAVSVSDLAAAMAIKRSSFYNSFGDRETVFRATLEVYRQGVPDAALAEIGPGQAVIPVVRKVFRDICRVRAADPEARGCLIVNSIGELVGVNAELGEDIADCVRGGAKVYERLLRQAAEQGEIEPPKDLRATARAFVAFVSGVNTISKVVRSERELWKLCETFLERYGFGAA